MEEETLVKNGDMKQRTSSGGGFMDDNRTATKIGGGGSINSTHCGEYGRDRLSALPDTLIITILSLLSFFSAAETSVLSRRWRHLWTHHPHLEFNSLYFPILGLAPSDKFLATIDHILRQLNSPNKIKTFNIFFKEYEIRQNPVIPSFLDSWVSRICGRNVEEIKVSLIFARKIEPLTLPNCVFQCQSLVKLILYGPGPSIYCKLPDDGVLSLNNLKELGIYSVKMEVQLAKKLFKSCPKLESLSLDLDELVDDEGSNQIVVVDVFAPCLKSLHLSGLLKRIKFVIDAPILEDIRLRGSMESYCFLSKPIRLLKADIRPEFVSKGGNYQSLMLEFFREISSVRKIDVYGDLTIFKALDCMEGDAARSIFPNLVELSMSDIHETDMNSDAPIPAWLLGKLKKVEVEGLIGLDDEIMFVEYILNHAKVLEELHVTVSSFGDFRYDESESSKLWKEYDFCRQLFTSPRSSRTCHIKLSGDYISGSSDNYRNGLLGSNINILGPRLWCSESGDDDDEDDNEDNDEDDDDI